MVMLYGYLYTKPSVTSDLLVTAMLFNHQIGSFIWIYCLENYCYMSTTIGTASNNNYFARSELIPVCVRL